MIKTLFSHVCNPEQQNYCSFRNNYCSYRIFFRYANRFESKQYFYCSASLRTITFAPSLSGQKLLYKICGQGAYENQQKSRNRPDPILTLQFLEIWREMRSDVWIRSISRFFRKFADGKPTKIIKNRKIVRIHHSLCNFLRFRVMCGVKVGSNRFLDF